MATLLMSWVSLLEQNLSTIFLSYLSIDRRKKVLYVDESFPKLDSEKGRREEKEDEDYNSAS